MGISNRLKTIAEAVTPGLRAADIGTDHGYVPICLLRNGISPYVIAADLSEGSLEKARENLKRAKYLEETAPDGKAKAECRLSDGLKEFCPGEVDAIILSGMGGILMDRILRDGIEVVRAAKELILSPHRDTQLLREFASEFGFSVIRDEEFTDKKKTYPLLKIRIRE